MRPSRRPRIFHVFADGFMIVDGRRLPCALGRGGVRTDKREGDGATPAGLFPLRCVHYRTHRAGTPLTALSRQPILRSHGWCDDPASPLYNRLVRLPFPARHERLWRQDRLYDALVTIGHNDRPARPGRGSAVFIHIMHPEGEPTDGCVALRPPDMRWLLRRTKPGDMVRIAPPERKSPGLPLRQDLRKRRPCAGVAIN
jgi:L,D-peptidoglycan transpeptidase YkuD (ErfK/YbiS/YcfS/YnhG family)